MSRVTNYDASNIGSLQGADRVRLRPQVMLGTNDVNGARHTVIEMLGNALDEASSGFGHALDVKYYEDDSVSIRDYGRGVPLGWNEKEQRYAWDLIYNELYAGGKYDDGQWYLNAIDRWYCETKPMSEDDGASLKIFRSVMHKNFGVDVESLPKDGTETLLGNLIKIKYEDGCWYGKATESWAELTWNDLRLRLNYLFSIGLNGLGAASTQYTSDFFNVTSYRDGKASTMKFRKGKPILDELIVEDTDEPNGTYIHWKPDDSVFISTDMGADWVYRLCADTLVISGLDFRFEDVANGVVKEHKAGNLSTLVDKYLKNHAVNKDEDGSPIVYRVESDTHGDAQTSGVVGNQTFICHLELIYTFTDSRVTPHCYHNSIPMDGGAQHASVLRAVEEFYNERARETGIKLSTSDYDCAVGVVLSSYSNLSDFKGQTKNEVHNSFIGDAVYNALIGSLNDLWAKGDKRIVASVDSVIERAQMRIQIQEAARQIRKATRTSKEKPEKFVSCRAYDRKDSKNAELWILEGDSALTALKRARNSDFQALFPIRGKLLNVCKASIDSILKNAEIMGIFNLLETGMHLDGVGEDLFNIENLRFDKIIFGTDADTDGFQIRVLLFLMFYRLAPELLRQGRVYIAETPLFAIHFSDGSVKYALTDAEKQSILKEANLGVREIKRFKGLGEVDAKVLRDTTVAPENRNLIQLKMDVSDEGIQKVVDVLFANKDSSQRKEVLSAVLGANVAELLLENASLLETIENMDLDEGIEYDEVEY